MEQTPYSEDELRILLNKAIALHMKIGATSKYGPGTNPCPGLYRNKDRSHFDDILSGDGIMKVHKKGEGNDPRCPVNDVLPGLLFCCNADNYQYKTYQVAQPINKSPYGSTRLLLSCEVIKSWRLYFADFYCYGGSNHYVTIVAAKPESEADKTCKRHHLIEAKEPFLFFQEGINGNKGSWQVSKHLWIELFYTENINISGMPLQHNIPLDPSYFEQKLYPMGKPKRGCAECLLREAPPTQPHVRAGQNAYQQQGGHPYINSSADADAMMALQAQMQQIQVSPQTDNRFVGPQSRPGPPIAPPTQSLMPVMQSDLQQQGGDGYFLGQQLLPMASTYPTPNPYSGQPAFLGAGAAPSIMDPTMSQQASGMLGQEFAGWGGGNQVLPDMPDGQQPMLAPGSVGRNIAGFGGAPGMGGLYTMKQQM